MSFTVARVTAWLFAIAGFALLFGYACLNKGWDRTDMLLLLFPSSLAILGFCVEYSLSGRPARRRARNELYKCACLKEMSDDKKDR